MLLRPYEYDSIVQNPISEADLNGFCIVTVKVLNSYVVFKIVRRNRFPKKIVTAK